MSGSHGATSGYLAFSSQQVERQFEESKPSILYQKHALLDEMLDYSVKYLLISNIVPRVFLTLCLP